MTTIVDTPTHEKSDNSSVAVGIIIGITIAVLVAAAIFMIFSRPVVLQTL